MAWSLLGEGIFGCPLNQYLFVVEVDLKMWFLKSYYGRGVVTRDSLFLTKQLVEHGKRRMLPRLFT
jgi:hypothetical protein